MINKIYNQLKQINIKSILKISLIGFIPFVLILLTFYQFNYKSEKEKYITLILDEQIARSRTMDSIISFIKNGVIDDLLVIKRSQEFQDYINLNTDINKKEASNLFKRISSNKTDFKSITFINNDGIEEIKITNLDRNIKIIDEPYLLNKNETEIFNETKKLNSQEFYFTDIDLLINNAELNQTNKPIIYIANPIYNENNEFIGILEISFDASIILSLCNNQIDQFGYDFVNLSLVNSDGFYLYDKDVNKRFSNKFDEKNFNIKNESKYFDEYKDSNLEYYVENNKIYSIKKLTFSKVNNTIVTNSNWYLIYNFNINDIPIVNESFIFYLSFNQFIIIILSYICFLGLSFLYYLYQRNTERLSLISTISNIMNESLIITNNKFEVIYSNEAFSKMSGYNKSELINTKINYLDLSIQDLEQKEHILHSLKTYGYWEGTLWYKTKEGILFPKLLKIYSYSKKVFLDNNNFIFKYTKLKKVDNKLSEIISSINFDEATKLPNEKLLLNLIGSIIETKINIFGLFCFSIINYDEIFFNINNDKKNLLLSNFLTNINTFIGDKDIIAQISKGSFVIVLLSYNNLNDINNFINDFFIYNKNKIFSDEVLIPFNLKGGISIYPKDNLKPKGLLENSYIALSEAKKLNKDYICFNRELSEEISNRHKFNLLLLNSIKNNELSVNYQPQINSITNKITGIEALMRWNNDELGNVSPYIFIPIAEESGFIINLGYWIFEQVFIDYKRIIDLLPFNFKICINISPIQFNDDNLISKIIELSNKYLVDLSKFEIEITENIFLKDKKLINSKIEAFKKLGFSVAIDDFGTGFSSLSYLKNLNIDRIKIDRSFIYEYPQKDNGTIAKIIINICNELKIKVITEGVETEEQVKYINSLGCKSIQGYYYSKPLSLLQLIDFINTHN